MICVPVEPRLYIFVALSGAWRLRSLYLGLGLSITILISGPWGVQVQSVKREGKTLFDTLFELCITSRFIMCVLLYFFIFFKDMCGSHTGQRVGGIHS